MSTTYITSRKQKSIYFDKEIVTDVIVSTNSIINFQRIEIFLVSIFSGPKHCTMFTFTLKQDMLLLYFNQEIIDHLQMRFFEHFVFN